MNIDTGEVRDLDQLTIAEQRSGRWRPTIAPRPALPRQKPPRQPIGKEFIFVRRERGWASMRVERVTPVGTIIAAGHDEAGEPLELALSVRDYHDTWAFPADMDEATQRAHREALERAGLAPRRGFDASGKPYTLTDAAEG